MVIYVFYIVLCVSHFNSLDPC